MGRAVRDQAYQQGSCSSPTKVCSEHNKLVEEGRKEWMSKNGGATESFTDIEKTAATIIAGGGVLRAIKAGYEAIVGVEAASVVSTVGAQSALQGAQLRIQLTAEQAAGARMPAELTGYTKHGLNQAISRDGVGVAPHSILNAFSNPLSISGQSGGRFMLTGRDAVIVVNKEGKVITTWATNSAGVRIP